MNSPLRVHTLALVVVLICSLGSVCAWAGASKGPKSNTPATSSSEISIPGPLRSFLRMAGISQKIPREDVMPLLARNVYMQGYEGGNHPTEFLILLNRYVQQARELATLAGSEEVIRVSNCEEAKPLLHALGYRVRQECGKHDTSVETADPERAFLTIDSGFPLPALEQTLAGGPPFEYHFAPSRVPLILTESDWTGAGNKREQHYSKDLIDTLLHDASMSRLYWAFSRLDPQTREFLKESVGLKKLLPESAVLDFYGSYICVRSGKVLVPGGDAAVPAWKSLVGTSPDNPADFIDQLVSKDTGWLAAYFDVLSRLSRSQQVHFTEGTRLRSFYEALRSNDPANSATRGAFRPAPGLLLLVTRQQWESNGEAHIPGGLQVWKEILRQKSDSKLVREWGKRANRLSNPDQLLQTMVALSRANTDFGPLQVYLVASEIDMRRPKARPLTSDAVKLLARKFELFSDQYRVFAEFPELSDASLTQFLDVAEGVDRIGNVPLRGNTLGTLQANLGLWQILARQGQIPRAQMNESWQAVLKPFAKIHSGSQLYEAGNQSLREVLRTATGKPRTSQDEIIELLAGPRQAGVEGKRTHQEIANNMRSVLDSQRLVTLDTINAIGDALQGKIQGKPVDSAITNMAEQLREFEMPRPIFKGSERSEWAAGIYNNSHTDAEMRADLGKVLSSSSSHSQMEDALGDLALFQRDTLVGLNYAYYEPPGAQALHNNPLLVRSHDFSAETVGGIKAVWQAPHLFGEGSPAGGGAHLVGSLADLPYALAEIEQDFIVPQNVQALIWRELVPGLITSAVLPRWWGISSDELHAITLYQKAGEELLITSAENADLRAKTLNILSDRMTPLRSFNVEHCLTSGAAPEALQYVTPADSFYLAAEYHLRYPDDKTVSIGSYEELQKLSQEHPESVNWENLSRDFGVPHPALAQTYGRELINLPPVPAFAGYSSRLLAESWDSGTLYWARLADETGSSAETLNHMVPELTRRMVENVFATDFEDWPALVRALHETAEEYRRTKVASLPAGANPSLP